MKNVVQFSGGKESTAMLLLLMERGVPVMRFSDGSERRRSERTTTTSYAGEIKIFRLKKNSSNGTIM